MTILHFRIVQTAFLSLRSKLRVECDTRAFCKKKNQAKSATANSVACALFSCRMQTAIRAADQ